MDANTPILFPVWFNSRLLKFNGQPYGKRRRDMLKKELRLPVFVIGLSEYIVPMEGDATLAKRSPLYQEKPRRGRPRANQAAD